jgi:hypothetical protein
LTSTTSWPRTAASGTCIREGRSPCPPQERPPVPTVPPCVDSGWSLLLAADNDRLRHHKCRILPISLCSRIFCRAVEPTISRSPGFQALSTSFGVLRSAPKRSPADSSEEAVPTQIHRSFRRKPAVVPARRSLSNGRRGAAGSSLVSEPAGQLGGRARRHSWWTSQPSTTSTNARIPVG